MRVLIATKNPGKARELSAILATLGLDAEPLPADAADVDETGTTFLANATLKAQTYAARHAPHAAACLADDSGLEVDALNGEPGVYSARFASRHDAGSGDDANNAHLLDRLSGVDDRAARFVCQLVLCDAKGRTLAAARGTVEGSIGHESRGDNGFGYDPLFVLPDGRHMAELDAEEKASISHRGVASRRLVDALARAGVGGGA